MGEKRASGARSRNAKRELSAAVRFGVKLTGEASGARSQGAIKALKNRQVGAYLTGGASFAKSWVASRVPEARQAGAQLMGESSSARSRDVIRALQVQRVAA
mmetsp:Transcript_9893/g.18172  ORF Transcript_9893/g.18172 Transcript_9893/m.18172 type:complete len:102 (-) Transcript_9893:761-1066(-)